MFKHTLLILGCIVNAIHCTHCNKSTADHLDGSTIVLHGLASQQTIRLMTRLKDWPGTKLVSIHVEGPPSHEGDVNIETREFISKELHDLAPLTHQTLVKWLQQCNVEADGSAFSDAIIEIIENIGDDGDIWRASEGIKSVRVERVKYE